MCILRHRGVQMILAYSWTRPAILVAGKGRGCGGWVGGGGGYCFCFFAFIPAPLSSLSLSSISCTISSISFLPFSGRRHKMTHKGLRVVKPQRNLSQQLTPHLAHNEPSRLSCWKDPTPILGYVSGLHSVANPLPDNSSIPVSILFKSISDPCRQELGLLSAFVTLCSFTTVVYTLVPKLNNIVVCARLAPVTKYFFS